MITRYSVTIEKDLLASRFGVEVPETYSPRYNAAPTQLVAVVTQESKGMSFFYWGATPAWSKGRPLGEKIINTHVEAIKEKPFLQKRIKSHRCLIPADGFYAWKRIGKKSSVPYRFTLDGGALFGIAGLWEEYDDEAGEHFHTFSMITLESNDSVKSIHERMPAILAPENESTWLSGDDSIPWTEILQTQVVLEHYSVSNAVNSTERDSKVLLQPSPATDQFGNLSLFD